MTMAVERSQFHSRRVKTRGQATIELALTLPFLIWLIAYTFEAYHSIHTSHVAQRYAAMNVWKRLDNRAQFVKDDVDNQPVSRNFFAVQYTDTDGKVPRRRIMFGPMEMDNIMGVCREPGCQ